MARLKALPALDIIRGFKGSIDYYLWKGLPCARKWPYTPPSKRTAASDAAAAAFGEVLSNYGLLAPLALAAYQETANGTPRTARDVYVSGVYGHLHESAKPPPPPPPPEEQMYDAYICLRDKKNQGTAGGTATAGFWLTRTLNDLHADTKNLCVLADNQFVLAAGTYRTLITCPAYRVNQHQTRLHNLTGDTTLLVGTSERTLSTAQVSSRSVTAGRFTIAADQTLEVHHRCSSTNPTQGFGYPSNWTDEIYTVAEFWRELPPP